jgi:hypothetical protein
MLGGKCCKGANNLDVHSSWLGFRQAGLGSRLA